MSKDRAESDEAVESQALSVYARKVPITKKDVERGYIVIDIYRIQRLFGMADPCLMHAMKKIMVPGQRKAGKSVKQDVGEAIYSARRFIELEEEESG